METAQSEQKGFCEENKDELKVLAKALVAPTPVEVASAASALLMKALTGSSVAAGVAEKAVTAAFGTWFADTADTRLLTAAQAFKKAQQDREVLERFAAAVEPLITKATGDVRRVLASMQLQQDELASNQQEGFDVLASAMWAALDGLSKLELGQTELLTRTTSKAPSRNFDLKAYRQAMMRRYAHLKLEELDSIAHELVPVTVKSIFIEQNAHEIAESTERVFERTKEVRRLLLQSSDIAGMEEKSQGARQEAKPETTLPVLAVTDSPAYSRLVILGHPGAGKSVLLQFLLLRWAEHFSTDNEDAALPLLIELRDYARLRAEGVVDNFFAYLHRGTSVRWHLDESQLDEWMRCRPSWMLFDGLDEVFDPALRREISIAIHRLAHEYPLVRVIVTSRTAGFQHQVWSDEGFRRFVLEDLDHRQINQFLHRWYDSTRDGADQTDGKLRNLLRAIDESDAIRQLAGNPLLLTMMAILNRTQNLPRDRVTLYEHCARLLLHQWKADSRFSLDPELAKASLDFQDKRRLMMLVAQAMLLNEHGAVTNVIPEKDLEQVLARGLSGIVGLRPERAARALVEQLRGRNYVLSSVGSASYSFVHSSFLDYFGALAILYLFETEQTLDIERLKSEIFGRWAEQGWHERLRLLVGMLAPRFAAQILTYLCRQHDPERAARPLLLAARCLNEVRYRDQMACESRQLLLALRELAEAELSPVTSHFSVVTRAIETVGEVWPLEPDAKDWLRTLAESKRHTYARLAAIQQLARGWTEDPQTRFLLMTIAISDPNMNARRCAMRELALHWHSHPETFELIKTLARHAEEPAVRVIATKELAEAWQGNPDAFIVLADSARFDPIIDVRDVAAENLAKHWRRHAETLPLLEELAKVAEEPLCGWVSGYIQQNWADEPGVRESRELRERDSDNDASGCDYAKELGRCTAADREGP